jgi:hypothetical protein
MGFYSKDSALFYLGSNVVMLDKHPAISVASIILCFTGREAKLFAGLFAKIRYTNSS